MSNIRIFPDTTGLADAAAQYAITTLNQAIAAHGQAVWILAGGTAPMAAYKLIADNYISEVDWSHVTFAIGDERIAPLDSPDSNWHAIEQIFLHKIPQATFLRPTSDGTAESGAGEYAQQLAALPKTADGLPRLDLVWLGMGEDGHTLSLFPDHPDFHPTDQLVAPIHHSPKPPADRLTLTLTALRGSQHTIVLASGASKADIVKAAQDPDSQLPIAQAARLTNADWYIDQLAGGSLS